ncbi:hypothetical protein RM780_06030 [Streptomyces sp. DSM 44917]|uniref:Uncharacterized protein n=1 Tax=Streptomyces boetiae TaxID=3075541 RepID=A0ABU2L5K9_9ACTN|nr:hypothetical protein [Streptomyces sp. DSM 44917]MDT0306518.1 hypothetical protein [Streptomyces sp. DSM 44917]
MELTAALRRRALARPAVLPVVLPGTTRVRLALERELRRLRWPRADGPAAADLLVVAGGPGLSAEAAWIDGLFGELPRPRVRVTVTSPGDAADALLDGQARLIADGGRPRRRGRRRAEGTGAGHHGHEEHAGHAAPLDHGEHGEHGTLVAGLPMAGRADDRDGLRLDRLHLSLGPALGDWPAGLVLRLALQGDVVQSAGVDRLQEGVAACPFWDEPWLRALRGERVQRAMAARRLCAAHLDSVGRLLAVAGWADLAALARCLRDRVLDGVAADDLRGELAALIRRGERSRTLRWLLRGLGPLPASAARGAGVTGPALAADGDVYDRFRYWLAEIGRAAADFAERGVLGGHELAGPRGRLDRGAPPSQALLAVLPGLLAGTEFAGARLIVASLDPDLDELCEAAAGARHG